MRMLVSSKKFRWAAVAVVAFVAAVYLANALVISLFAPSAESKRTVKTFGSIDIVMVEDLGSGGSWAARSTEGYVNLAEPDPVIYVDRQVIGDKPFLSQTDRFVRHETAHVLQKEMIAKKAGGYPSCKNPLKTGKFLYYTLKLNHDYAEIMPPAKNAEWWRNGLESAADCYSVSERSPKGSYVDSCTKAQKKEAIGLISGRWPGH